MTNSNTTDTELFQILKSDSNNFIISDIYGQQQIITNFNDSKASNPELDIVLLHESNGSSFKTLNRVFSTTSDIALTIDETFIPNENFPGDWNIQERSHDLITGEVLPQIDGSSVFIDVFNTKIVNIGIKFTDSNGIFFQGVMQNGMDMVFRLMKNPFTPVPIGQYATINGSSSNFNRDIVGVGKFIDVNNFQVTIVLQRYDSPTGLQQFLLIIDGERINPLITGDIDGNTVLNEIDRTLLKSMIGLSKTDINYNIAADIDSNGYIDFRDLQKLDNQPIMTKNITSAMTGLWYDPSHNGEGWDFQIIASDRAIVTWYTYDATGNPIWLIGEGSIINNEIIVTDFRTPSIGIVFGDLYDPSEIVLEKWGEARFYFESCNNGGMSYNSSPEFGHNGLKLVRLTSSSGLSCNSITIPMNDASRFSGIWFDPSHNGEGWIIEGLDNNSAAITWYTYDTNGTPMWLIGIGSVVNNTLTVSELISTNGAIFGNNFNPDDVNRVPWGSLVIEMENCSTGLLTYNSTINGFGNGTLQSIRLAGVPGIECTD